MDLKDISSKLIMDVICSTAYSLDVNAFTDSNTDFHKYGKMIMKSYKRNWEFLALFFVPTIARVTKIKLFSEETTVFLRKLFWAIITRRNGI